ncbi:undecaprenyl diphosphate synthase family protein [Methanoplanus sp. FWC-SCC4]|uniref:Undecaprenyl diphosphate synthase family protein n=2 Tax=Methanochimaera problematica TaxID=2609417 RepID=A0AA97FFZ7_9EURY|nr:undecaprenyl diphosphate synthase family protein [Methanoplanus sp. FWC-SCC4]
MLIHRYYEWKLKRELKSFPDSLCFMITGEDITDAPQKPLEVVKWCKNLGISRVIFHINTKKSESVDSYISSLKKISEIARLTLHTSKGEEVLGEGMDVFVAVGMSGRNEIASAVKKMAEEGIDPDIVEEKTIDSYLEFRNEPDLVIKTGGNHLTDFLIWQSVYSELFFSDVNWINFRKIDLLRALRDYQTRKRRYGK